MNISHNFQGKRMLIVEDTMQSSIITGQILKRFGFEIQVATGGQEAYDKLNAAPEGYFDAVIMDIDINAGDELQNAVKIRTMANDGKSGIPIVVLTSNETEQITAYVEEEIITAVIKKPYDTESMTGVFTELFSKAEV